MNVFETIAKIFLDTSDYEKSLSSAEKNTSTFASSIGKGIKTSAKIGAAAVGAVTAAVTLTGKKMYSGVSEMSKYGDEIDKTSQKVGMSAEAYQEWDYVMRISGTEMSNMTTGLKTLTNKFDDAKSGGDASIEMFEKLGLSMEDISDLSRDDLFSTVITQFQQMEDSTERAALANDLFGRSGQELMPLFNTSIEETRKLKEEARDYGTIMSNDAVKASANFQDRLTRLNSTMRGVKQNIYGQFMPGITSIVEGFADVIAGNEDANDALSEGFTQTIDSLTDSLPRILETGGKILSALAQGIVNNLPKIANAGLDIIVRLTRSLISSLPKIADTAVTMISELADGIVKALPELIPMAAEMVVTIAQGLADNADKLIKGAAEMFTALIKGFSEAVPIIIKALPGIIADIVNAIGNNFTEFLPLIGIAAGKSLLGGLETYLLNSGTLGRIQSFLHGPGGIVTGLAAGVALIGVMVADAMDEAYNTAYEGASKIGSTEQAIIDKLAEEAGKWDEVREARKETAQNVDETIGTYKELWDRLNEIVDAQGNVKKGYEEEAEYITGELSQKLGIEIKMVDGQIQKYDELKDTIDEVIAKKRGEMMLEAFRDDYITSIKKQKEAEETLAQAQGLVNEQALKVKEAQEKVAKVQEKINKLDQDGMKGTYDYQSAYQALETELNTAKGELDGATTAFRRQQGEVEVAKNEVEKYEQTISNYDRVQSAVAHGGIEEMNNSITIMTNSMKTASNATKKELEQQAKDYLASWQEKREIAQKMGDIQSKEEAKQAKAAVDAAVAALGELAPKTASQLKAAIKAGQDLKPNWAKIGENAAVSLGQGFKDKSYIIKDAASAAMKTAIDKAKKVALIASPSKVWRNEIGQMMGLGLALGMDDTQKEVAESAENLFNVATGANLGEITVGGAPEEYSDRYGANDITINIYGAEGQDVSRIAEEVSEVLQRMYKREVARFA